MWNMYMEEDFMGWYMMLKCLSVYFVKVERNETTNIKCYDISFIK